MAQPANGFKKGQSGNSKGRGKGVLNGNTKRMVQLKALAAQDYAAAYKLLWKYMKAGEGWAFNLYHKLLPKSTYLPTVMNPQATDSDSRLRALAETLQGFDNLTREEVLEEIQVLSKVQLAENPAAGSETLLEALDNKTFNRVYGIIKESQQVIGE